MHLFTSSSKCKFIFQCIVSMICICTIYIFVIALIPRTLQAGNQWQTNILKAQNFSFSDKEWDVVLVGSSMAYNVPIEKLSNGAFNLAFAGGATNTGLEMVCKVQKYPKVILIEANETVLRGIDDKLMKKTDKWIRTLPFLQEMNRPDVVFFQTMQYAKRKIKGEKNILPVDRDEPVESALKRQQEASQKNVDETLLKEKLNEIKKRVSELEQAGVKVIFIEPPNHISLFGTIREKQVHDLFLEKFPQDKYDWFFVDWNNYKTNDGIHLGAMSANKYAEELIEYSNKFIDND